MKQLQNQIWRGIASENRTLKLSEKNYSQLQKEILSIVFAYKKFHGCFLGQEFPVYNEHLDTTEIYI